MYLFSKELFHSYFRNLFIGSLTVSVTHLLITLASRSVKFLFYETALHETRFFRSFFETIIDVKHANCYVNQKDGFNQFSVKVCMFFLRYCYCITTSDIYLLTAQLFQ